jgi:hypothetical protein
MLKKILINFLIIIVIFFLLFLILKDYLLKAYIVNYAKTNLGSTCTIQKAHLGPKEIIIENLVLSKKGVDLNFKNINIPLDINKILKLRIDGVALDTAVLKIKNLQSIKTMLPAAKGVGVNTAAVIALFNFDLKDISIKLEQAYDFNLNLQFSLMGKIENNKVIIDNIAINDGSLKLLNFDAKRINLKKYARDLYNFDIGHIAIVNKEFKDIRIPLKIRTNEVIFPQAKNALFGKDAYVRGIFHFDGKKSYLDAEFKDISFNNIISIFSREDNANIEGTFDGNIIICWQDNRLIKLISNFRSKSGGFINIKKEASLGFLKTYLDGPSYKALIDNLKNYEYNIGELSINNEEDVLSFKLSFSSEKMGKRNLTINLHNALGGAK